jgi:hypothetical protein
MGPVGLAPLAEQRDDRLDLLVEQPVHRGATGLGVDEVTTVAPGEPAVDPDFTEFELTAGPTQRPALIGGLVEQLEKSGLGGRIDPAWDLAT